MDVEWHSKQDLHPATAGWLSYQSSLRLPVTLLTVFSSPITASTVREPASTCRRHWLPTLLRRCLRHRCVSMHQASPGSHLHPAPGMSAGLGSWPGPAAPANELCLHPGAPPSSLCRNPTNISWRLKQINTIIGHSYSFALSNIMEQNQLSHYTLFFSPHPFPTHCGPTSRPSLSSCSSPAASGTNPQQHGPLGLQPAQKTGHTWTWRVFYKTSHVLL